MKDVVNFLKKARYLIKLGTCRFEERKDKKRDYLQILVEDFCITLDEAWYHIKSINQYLIYIDDKPDYYEGSNAYIFKKEINGVMAYIKMKIEIKNDEEELVVISFHMDKRRNR